MPQYHSPRRQSRSLPDARPTGAFGIRRGPMARRVILRGAGVSMALPFLSAMDNLHASGASSQGEGIAPRRFVSMTMGLGLHASNLNPKSNGRQYVASPYLRSMQDIRDRFSVISGTSHPGVKGGHRAEASLLTANPVGSSGRSKNTISVDQLLAKHLGSTTRFASMTLSISGGNSPCYTEMGAMVPAIDSPGAVFDQLFVDGTAMDRKRQAMRVRQGRSIMDLVAEDARTLQRDLGPGDRDRLDAYFTGVRDLEKRLAIDQRWAQRPKPTVNSDRPVDIASAHDVIGRQRLMNDMMRLALQTDSTCFISLHLGAGSARVPIDGVMQGYHALSHHGMDEEKLQQLALVETAIVAAWGDFLRSLNQTQDQHGSLLDNTAVLLTSNLGNASNHSNSNMPVLLGGGDFQHGQHLAFDQKNNYPLPRLFVSVMQWAGLQQDSFGGTSGTMTGL